MKNPYIEVTKFAAYINSFDDGALFNICSAFAKSCPGISTFNVGDKLAELFQSILLNAVKTKKGKRASTPEDAVKERYGISLVIEANGACPNDWCNNELETDIDGKTQLCYELVKLDESQPDSYENYIAVCSSCYKKNGTRNAPVIKFENVSKYTFYTPGDGGLGTGYKSLIVFDLSILNLTPLPAAAHDSLMFNHIGYEPLEKIMELYMQSGKQIFIAYDKQEAPTPRIQEILDETIIIHLSENGNELFGYSWAKKTNKEENVAE